jgi:phycocyanin-associated rod linker protein
LGRNSASTVIAPSGSTDGFAYRPSVRNVTPSSTFGGVVNSGQSGRLFRVEVASMNLPRYPNVRRINQAFIVPYEELSNQMQKVQRMGGKIASVTPV